MFPKIPDRRVIAACGSVIAAVLAVTASRGASELSARRLITPESATRTARHELRTTAEVAYEANETALDGLLDDHDEFGTALAALGDLNGDGVPDLAVGASGDDDVASSGAVWLLFLGDTGKLQSASKITPASAGLGVGAGAPGFTFADAVGRLGDLNGDDVPDLAIGDPAGAGGLFERGRLWMLRVKPAGGVESHTNIHGGAPPQPVPGCAATSTLTTSTTLGVTTTVGEPTTTTVAQADPLALPIYYRDRFGSSVDSMRVAASGPARLAIGAPESDVHGCDTGAVWIIDLNESGGIAASARIAPDGTDVQGGFGTAVAWLGDLDGDGMDELAVGEPWRGDYFADGHGDSAVWLLSVAPDRSMASTKRIDRAVIGDGPHLGFGRSLAALGDVDGDGIPELGVGDTPIFGDSAAQDGSVAILFLASDGSVRSTKRILTSDVAFDGMLGDEVAFRDRGFASSLAAAGDLDGDGIGEIAIGVPAFRPGPGESRGAIFVVYLDAEGGVKHARRITDESPNTTTTTTSLTSTTGCPHFCSTSTTSTIAPDVCGDAAGGGTLDATDALVTLSVAVGLGACPALTCDVDCSSAVTARDALMVLRAAVGTLTLDCECPLAP